jgi:aryl-alcohol dehydrogenase-like predicted oxidoreductase
VRYRALGRTGIQVSPYCLGTMMFGAVGNPDHADCARIIHTALDRGINFVDTADMYSDGESEVIVGKALDRPDPDTDIEETLGALSDLVHQGKIRAFGCSTFPAEQIVEAQHVSERAGLLRFRTEQPPYSALARGIEAAVLPVCQRYGMGVMVWSPLASGFLSGRVRRGRPAEQTMNRPSIQPDRFDLSRPENQAKLDATERLAQVAANAGCSLAAMAIAFTLAHPAVTSAIIGPRTIEQLESLLDGADLVLDDATLDRIDEIVPPGTSLTTDGLWRSPALSDPTLRRRPPGARAAAHQVTR